MVYTSPSKGIKTGFYLRILFTDSGKNNRIIKPECIIPIIFFFFNEKNPFFGGCNMKENLVRPEFYYFSGEVDRA